MNGNQLLPGKTFSVNLSEIEVRMTLRELCGPKSYDYPFTGEVHENSFSFTENHFGIRRNIGGLILEGSFYEEDGKTTISISPNFKSRNLTGNLIFAAVGAFLLSDGMHTMLTSLFNGGENFLYEFSVAVAGGIFLGIEYHLLIGSFQKSIKKIQKAFNAAQHHT